MPVQGPGRAAVRVILRVGAKLGKQPPVHLRPLIKRPVGEVPFPGKVKKELLKAPVGALYLFPKIQLCILLFHRRRAVADGCGTVHEFPVEGELFPDL